MVQPHKGTHTSVQLHARAAFFLLYFVHVCPVFAEFSFTCMVGLTNALEQDGFISGFMGFYLRMVR